MLHKQINKLQLQNLLQQEKLNWYDNFRTYLESSNLDIYERALMYADEKAKQ